MGFSVRKKLLVLRPEIVRKEGTPEVPQGYDKGHPYRTETLF